MTQVQRTMDHLRKALEKSSDTGTGSAGQSSTVRDWMQPLRDSGAASKPAASIVSASSAQTVSPEMATLSAHRLIAASGENPAVLDRYRLLRTRVQQIVRPKGWSVIGLTSSTPGAGKTLTTLNLAITFARAETSRVIVIDADLRKPSVADMLGARPEFGLCDYLAGDAEIQDIVYNASGIENFSFIPGAGIRGTAVANPSELLASPRLDALIKSLRAADAVIFVDTPPLQIGDDVLSVAQRTDCFLIVVEEAKTTVTELKEAATLLREHNIIGTVLNKSSTQPKHFESYYTTGDKPETTRS